METVSQTLVTAYDMFRMPADGVRRELVRGELFEMSPVGTEHGFVLLRLGYLLTQFLAGKKLGRVAGGDVGFVLTRNPDTVRALDIAFLSKSTLSKKSELSKYWEGAPDLAIEILSPNDTQSQLEDKAHELLEAGTKAVWVVDPKRKRVWIHKSDAKPVALESNDFLEGESILPGFRIQVGSIFEDD